MSAEEMKWLDELNPDQRRAVTHSNGPLLVVAGAGSGKTKTLAYRVSYLIKQGMSPERILLLTFTRRAAEEMLKRATQALGPEGQNINKVWGGTFHATANRLLRMYAKSAGISQDFTIMDQSDAEDFINVLRHEKGFSKKDKRFPRKGTCLAIYSRRVNGSESLETVLKRHFPWCEMWKAELKALFQEYVNRKQMQNVLDYDDLLLYWYYLLEDKDLAKTIEERFDAILVDEYQDTNRIQSDILRRMRMQNKNIMVVGDDAQSIYSFRSATVRNMLDFPKHFEGTTVVTLQQNYRSVKPILETSNLVIAQAQERYSKDLWSKREQGQRPALITCGDEDCQDQAVIEKILLHYEQGISLKNQAVLFRSSSHSSSLELALTRKNIPFHKYGGLRFLEAAHIKDLISLLRILENPQDQMAWFRILQLLDGVGPATAEEGFVFVRENGFDPSSIGRFPAPPSARHDLKLLGALMEELKTGNSKSPAVEIDRIGQFYVPVLKKNYENPEPRVRDIEHLSQIAARYKTRQKFLSDLILDPPNSTGNLAGPPIKDEDWLVLSTIHSAKGCEWDVVYLIHASDGCLPSDMATDSQEEIEEELRLTYVALTRARDYLYVLWPMRYYHKNNSFGDSHSYAQRSRFFTENVIGTMDQLSSGKPEKEPDTVSKESSKVDIGNRIKSLWD